MPNSLASPLFLAVFIGWIFSVCIHEYAHALVAYCGGDTSVKEKGYLSLNFLAYIDPVTSILIPAAFLVMGGIPLPGGAVRIDASQLRSRHWSALVSLAGPVANLLIFLLIALIIHPRTGLVNSQQNSQPTWALFLGALCVLEIWSVLFNLIPVPPMDGFGILEPYLPWKVRHSARTIGWTGLIVLYFILRFDPVSNRFMDGVDWILKEFGLPFESTWRGYNAALFGASD